jgi:adenylate kinase
MTEQQPAVVLLGPTGSGKTPLGALLEQKGLSGRRCAHFDFGQELRAVAARSEPDGHVTMKDVHFVRHVLDTHALLEDKDFPLAGRILDSFLRARRADANTIVVMNGLPRHVGQAEALDAQIAVRAVIVLECPPETVRRRIAANAGGDRADRVDDDATAIERKLRTFTQRTLPLIDYYRQRGAELVTIPVTAAMTAEEMGERCHEHCR